MSDAVNHPLHYNASPATCECGKPIERELTKRSKDA